MSAAPFVGVDAGAQTTVFFRASPTGTEGFVVDNSLLVHTLKERVLDERGLSFALELDPAREGVSSIAGSAEMGGAYLHQFSEPLSSVEAWLRLAPLEVPLSERLLIPFTLLLGGLVIVGLLFLYRLTKSQVEFAQRQSNFVSAVTHELKTPLTAIRMHGEMLKEGLVESPEKAQEYFGTITAQAERLSRLIGNVLSLSEVERNPGTPPVLSSLRTPITNTARALKPHVEKCGFDLVMDLPKEIPQVLLDEDSVEQIVFNLVENAIKYAKDAADRRITIGIEVRERTVDLFVRDRGPGVPVSQLKKIFEPFFRGENELTRKSTGTGLGLALVALLAERMGAGVEARLCEPGMAVCISLRCDARS
jgi:signal transduction histidine kinase